MGTSWPPRSYTCIFCKREFRSAQALGGHMNVHHRDRARLHQSQPPSSVKPNLSSTSPSSSPFIIPTQEFSTAGLSLLCKLPNNQGPVLSSINMNACAPDSPSTLLSMSPNPSNKMVGQSLNFLVQPQMLTNSCHLYFNKVETPSSIDYDSNTTSMNNCNEFGNHEELDLELRLGHSRPTTSSSS